MSPWVRKQIQGFRSLTGWVASRWVGMEMALREVGPSGEPVFFDPQIPFLQVAPLYLACEGGRVCVINTYQNDTQWGLSFGEHQGDLPPASHQPGSIFRTREVPELPVGRIEAVHLIVDDLGDLSEVSFDIGEVKLSLMAGEVYEDMDGSLRVVKPDESVLVLVRLKGEP